MKHSPFSCLLFSVLLCALLLSPALSVAQNELVSASDAVQLRRVWTQEGTEGNAQYGYNVWGGVDISGDSIADFAVYQGKVGDNAWFFYRGGEPLDTLPFIVRPLLSGMPPIVGDFFGDGARSIAFVRGRGEVINGTTYFFYATELSRLTDTGIAEEVYDSTELRALLQLYGGDLDGESGDEVVLIDKFDGSNQPGRILVYRGGPEFTLDSPTVIIYDSGSAANNAPSNWQVRFADFDGDGRTDMVMGGSYPTGGPMLRFYWGDENSPWSWATRPPDYDVQLKPGETGISSIVGMGIYDLNGDGAADIGATIGSGEEAVGRLYLSGRGKDPRRRTYTIEDADWTVNKTVVSSARLGFLNDSTRRYEMLRLGGTVMGNQAATFGMTATDNGLDYDYEAWYAPGLDGLRNESLSYRSGPIGDVTGDGYEDVIFASRFWQNGVYLNAGIAIVLAGGEYVPFDDPSLNVVEHPVAGESGGLYLWPNPVVDELHIAWKGNLKRMPARFTVFDVLGQEVVSGDVEPYRGAALWRCGSVAAGTYTVVAYDAQGGTIAAARVVKR